MKTRGSFESEQIPLWPLFKHHFNLKHLLGVVNWHLPRNGMHKHSFINLSTLTFPYFICLPQPPPFPLPFSCLCFHFSFFSLPSSSVPCFPSATSPLCLLLPIDYTTYSHEYICVILLMQLRQTYLRILGGKSGFCNAPSSIKKSL